MINGVEQTALSNVRKISTGGQDDVGNAAGGGFIQISSTSDIVTFRVKSNLSADEFFPIHAQLALVELDESTSPDYAEMHIIGNDISQSVVNTFSEIANFTSGILEG